MPRTLPVRPAPVACARRPLYLRRDLLDDVADLPAESGISREEMIERMIEEGLERRGRVILTLRSQWLLEQAERLSGLPEVELLVSAMWAKYRKAP